MYDILELNFPGQLSRERRSYSDNHLMINTANFIHFEIHGWYDMHTLKLVCLSSLPAPVVMTLLPPVEAGAGGFAGLLADTAEADIVDVADADLVNLPDIVLFSPYISQLPFSPIRQTKL
jgi:hypothetical protein